ncbi:acetyl-CoA carboxylase biotin carboxyl carrier protein [Pseudonocardia benzenivorans]
MGRDSPGRRRRRGPPRRARGGFKGSGDIPCHCARRDPREDYRRRPVCSDDSHRRGRHHRRRPSPGLFWRAPSPGAPPFTDIGGHVEEGTALCIVEVMKLMNTLPAPVAGTVVEICAENGEQVDTGTPLFRIRADGS